MLKPRTLEKFSYGGFWYYKNSGKKEGLGPFRTERELDDHINLLRLFGQITVKDRSS